MTRCLLVTTRGRRDGILVDCQGYNYARYSCYVPEKRSLDLRDVPVDHYDLKLRQPRRQRVRCTRMSWAVLTSTSSWAWLALKKKQPQIVDFGNFPPPVSSPISTLLATTKE